MKFLKLSICLMMLMVSMNFAQSDESVISAKFISSVEQFKPGDSYSLAVEVNIQQPFHINAQKPSEEFLIPTTLKIEVPPRVALGKISFPKALVKKFEFSESPLAVYEGIFHIFTTLSISDEYQEADLLLQGTLGYQACDHHTCMAPDEITLYGRFKLYQYDSKMV